MNKIIECIKKVWKTCSLRICYILIPLILIIGCTHSCIANQGFIKTLDKHQQVLSLIQDSILGSTNESLTKSNQDSLTKTIKQIITPNNINSNSIRNESDQRNIMVVATLNLQQEGLLKEIKEISKEIQAYGKLFFDSNTVTFLISLVVTLLLAIFFESQKAMTDLIDKTKGLPRKFKKSINVSTQNMDLYIKIYALFNLSVTIRQSLNIYLTKKENIDLLPELVYQANRSIDDINMSLGNKFKINKGLFDMMYKTLCASKQNLFFRETFKEADEETKQEANEELITILLSDVTDNIDRLLKELEKRRTK